jgi:hypothetical protein
MTKLSYTIPEYIGQEETVYEYVINYTKTWTMNVTYFNGMDNFNYFNFT